MKDTLYYYDSLNKISAQQYKEIYAILPTQIKEHISKYRFQKDRNISTLCYGILLKKVINNYNYTELEQIFYFSKTGKPSFNVDQIDFNISHCKGCIAVAIATKRVGVDVESFITYYKDIMSLVCHPNEINKINRSKTPQKLFTIYWTLKESFVKMIGCGITDKLLLLDFSESLKKKIKRTLFYGSIEKSDYIISYFSESGYLEVEKIEYEDLDLLF